MRDELKTAYPLPPLETFFDPSFVSCLSPFVLIQV